MDAFSNPGRTRVIVAVALVAVLVVGGVFWWQSGGDSDEVDTARATTSEPTDESTTTTTTATTTAVPGGDPPPTQDETPPTGTDPSIALETVVDIDGASAVVDPAGAGPVLVSTLDGRVLAVDLGTGAREVVLDLTERVSVGGERGLLGMAIDPEGERLHLNYTDSGGDTDIRSWPLADGRPSGDFTDGVVHLEIDQPYANHNGGNLVFGPDGQLWIGTGDGGSAGDPEDRAQDPDTLLGKMLRVTPDPSGGVVASDSNPDWGGRPEIWGIGLRNPWRYSFDRETARLWIADVGQNTTEEVSVVEPDASMPNFGWNHVEGDRPFAGEPAPSFVEPVVTYRHGPGCSITGGYVYRGQVVASLHGWYLFGDHCGGFIHAVPADDPEQEPVELIADAGPVVSFAELEDGELLVLTQAGISRIVSA